MATPNHPIYDHLESAARGHYSPDRAGIDALAKEHGLDAAQAQTLNDSFANLAALRGRGFQAGHCVPRAKESFRALGLEEQTTSGPLDGVTDPEQLADFFGRH